VAEAADRILAPTPRKTRVIKQIKSAADRAELRQPRPPDTHPPSMPKKSVSPDTGAVKVSLDRPLHAALARFTLGISPAALSQAYLDWLRHILFSPDKQSALAEMTTREWTRYLEYCRSACADPNCPQCIEPLPQDKRFAGEAWQKWPFKRDLPGFSVKPAMVAPRDNRRRGCVEAP
jgi:poly(hydroxyalkanoate) polymerase-like protein